jgi:hypothetical protein
MKKLLAVCLAVMLCAGISFAQDGDNSEEIILTTYYPAPYGEYNSLSVGSGYAAPAEDGNLVVEGRVGIGTTDPQAILDISSTTSGFLPPRMSSDEMNAISGPLTGSIIYNTSANQLNVYNGNSWQLVGGGSGNYHPLSHGNYVTLIDGYPGAGGVINLSPHLPVGVNFVKLRIHVRRRTGGRGCNTNLRINMNNRDVYAHFSNAPYKYTYGLPEIISDIQVELDANQQITYSHWNSVRQGDAVFEVYTWQLIGFWD